MILQLDVGNSSIKWRAVETDASVCARGIIPNENTSQLGEYLKNLRDVKNVYVSSVAGLDKNLSLSKELKLCFAVEPIFVVAQQEFGGVINGYQYPERLGVDRWLAILAAYNEFKTSCIVIDLGSAVTVDVVNASGHHLGGYIIPGFEMQRKALLKQTQEVRFDNISWSASTDLGQDTYGAVTHGIVMLISSFLDNIIAKFKGMFGGSLVTVVTGGDAKKIISNESKMFVFRQDLVLDGLSVVGCINLSKKE